MGCPVWNTCQRTRQGLQCCISCFLTAEHDSRKGGKESGMLEGTNCTGLHEPTLHFYHIFKDLPSSPCFQDESKITSCYYYNNCNIWTTAANIILCQASFSVLLGCHLHTTFLPNMSSQSFHTGEKMLQRCMLPQQVILQQGIVNAVLAQFQVWNGTPRQPTESTARANSFALRTPHKHREDQGNPWIQGFSEK